MSLPASAVFDEYWSAVRLSDRQRAVGAVADSALPVQDQLALVCRAQERLGEHWQQGIWSVAQEHAATAIAEDVIVAIGLRHQAPVTRGVVVVACGEGERHSLPARALSELLRIDGWRCYFLGASVPSMHVSGLVEDLCPAAVAVSCSLPSSLWSLRELVERSRALGVPVLVGGRGVGRNGAWGLRLGANRWARDAAAASALLSSPEWPEFVAAAPLLGLPDDDARSVRVGAYALADSVARHLPRGDALQLVRHLAAALLVDDLSLFTDYLDWQADAMRHLGLPSSRIVSGLEALELSGPRAARFRDKAVTVTRGL